LAFLLVAACFAAPVVGADIGLNGYSRARDDGRLLYVESHLVRDYGQLGETRVVMYRCSPRGPAFARKGLRYGEVREEPEFTFTDARSDYVEGLVRTAQGPRVFQQEGTRGARREAPVPKNVAIVSDAGFDEFVRNHWSELEEGKTVRFPFLIPSRLDYLTFKVKKNREQKLDGEQLSVIRLNLSGVLGWFLPYIEVSYRKRDRILMRYEGLTNIRDTNGQNLVAIIDFPVKERRTVATADLAAAKAETLVSRCP
jgi:hypothetical protein